MTTLKSAFARASRRRSDITIRNVFIIPTIVFLIVFKIFPLILFAGYSFTFRASTSAPPISSGCRTTVSCSPTRSCGPASPSPPIRDHLGHRPGAGRFRRRHAAQSRHPDERPPDDPAAVADDAVDGGGRAVLEAALRPILRHHQLCAGARRCRVAVQRQHGALRRGAHRHLDVVALRHAAVAGRPVGRAEAPLRGGSDRSRRLALHLLPHHAADGRRSS